MGLNTPFKTTCPIPVVPEVPAQKVASLLPAHATHSLSLSSSEQVMPLVWAPLDLREGHLKMAKGQLSAACEDGTRLCVEAGHLPPCM